MMLKSEAADTGVLLENPLSASGQTVAKGHRGPKSKTGCVTCKGRRIKCDEKHPICQQCSKKQLECIYAPPRTSVLRHSTNASRSEGQHRKDSQEFHSATRRDSAPDRLDDGRRFSSSVHQRRKVELAQIAPRRHFTSTDSGSRQISRATSLTGLSKLEYSPGGQSDLSSPLGSGRSTGPQDFTSRPQSHDEPKETGPLSSKSTPCDEETYLTNVFFETSTHLFSIYTGACNPFMSLRKYLSHSKAFRLAVQAMAALTVSDYQSRDKQQTMDRGLELQRLAYRELSYVLADPAASLSDATFAAVVHIGMAEPWHSLRSDQSGAMHLRTSKVLICQRHLSHAPLPPRYLCNLLLYWDLLVSLHSDSTHDGYSTDMLFSGNHSEEHPIDHIDPTTGVATLLFQIIVEMENFLRYWRTSRGRVSVDDQHHLQVALAIERRLNAWRPEIDANRLLGCMDVFSSCPLQDILFTAEAYRQTALLLLYRTIPGILQYAERAIHDTRPFLQELAASVMKLLSAIPISSPVCTTHEWVLFVSSPDVARPQDREFIRNKMSGLLDKIGVIGIREVMDYIENVWQMVDHNNGDSSMWMEDMHRRNWYPLLG